MWARYPDREPALDSFGSQLTKIVEDLAKELLGIRLARWEVRSRANRNTTASRIRPGSASATGTESRVALLKQIGSIVTIADDDKIVNAVSRSLLKRHAACVIGGRL